MSSNYSPRRVIVGYAKGAWYPRGIARLKESLDRVGYSGETRFFSSEAELGAPLHSDIPYAFKIMAIEKVISEGFDQVMWLDASVWAIKSLDAMWDTVSEKGYLFFHTGFNTAQWSSNASLKHLKLTRDEAESMPLVMGGIFGLDAGSSTAMEWLRQVKKEALDGTAYRGAWTNANGEVSADPRVKGHRHDQVVFGVVCFRLGIHVYYPVVPQFFRYKYVNQAPLEDAVCLQLAGM